VLVCARRRGGALAAFRAQLTIAETLIASDPRNAEWQTDLASSCASLGTLEHGQSLKARRDYPMRGRAILQKLKAEGRLMSNQDWAEWFEQQLRQLPVRGS
jgi:3-methyladenine DNA glycosylase AlkC